MYFDENPTCLRFTDPETAEAIREALRSLNARPRFYASRRRDEDSICKHTPYTVRDHKTGAWYGHDLTKAEAEAKAAEMNEKEGQP